MVRRVGYGFLHAFRALRSRRRFMHCAPRIRRIVSRAPVGRPAARAGVALGVAGAVAAALGGCGLLLRSEDATFASDDAGDGGVGSKRNATGLIATDPASAFRAYLKAPAPQVYAWFGEHLATNGVNVAVTSPLEDVMTDGALVPRGGATYVFSMTADGGAPLRLVAPGVAAYDGDLPGSLLSGPAAGMNDWGALRVTFGDRSLVVATCARGAGTGAAYAYDLPSLAASPAYVPQTFAATSPRAGDFFGEAIAASGPWLAIGAPGDSRTDCTNAADQSAPGSGAVYLYERQGTSYAYAGCLKASNAGSADAFGEAVAMDGDLLAIGAPGEDGRGQAVGADPSDNSVADSGAVYIYRLSSAGWTFEAYLKPAIASPSGYFGFSLSVSAGRVAVGAPETSACDGTQGASNLGVAYVASQHGSAWLTDSCLPPSTGQEPVLFGLSVSLLGGRLVVGAPWDSSDAAVDPVNVPRTFTGAAHLFSLGADGGWLESGLLRAPTRHVGDVFGYATALAPGLLVIGAYQESGNGAGPNWTSTNGAVIQSGAVYVYSVGP